jgi:hypothetical protein
MGDFNHKNDAYVQYQSEVAQRSEGCEVRFLLLHSDIAPGQDLEGYRVYTQSITFLALLPPISNSSTYVRIGYGSVGFTAETKNSEFLDYILRDWNETILQLD